MDGYFAYIRVSTVKQGERGTSLEEQRSAIEAYASRHGLTITAWFEEMETAAKQGRRQFARMLAQLGQRRARGVIIHKIDRSARNLKDWAQLGDLMDAGVEVHFAHESLDLSSRGGRLSADIQAVVAADYIRNLRQEVIKGFYGRLKQGLYPLPAPRGYLDQGKGKPKVIDPVVGPLVRQAFELYASGSHTFHTLRTEMAKRGLLGKSGKPLSLEAVSILLRNPFYAGLIRIERTSEMFEGIHEPLVRKAVFDRVQALIDGRAFARPQKHDLAFRRMIRCAVCGYSLIGEVRKGHVYYRCHTATCRGTILREPDIEDAVRERLALLAFANDEMEAVREIAKARGDLGAQQQEQARAALQRDLAKCDERFTRLTDAYIDGAIDKETFEARKATLFSERRLLRDGLEEPTPEPFAETVLKILGRANTAYLGFDLALPDEKRDLVREVTSDLRAQGKNLEITMRNEFQVVLEWRFSAYGAPCPCGPRTLTSSVAAHTNDEELRVSLNRLLDRLTVAVPQQRGPERPERPDVPSSCSRR